MREASALFWTMAVMIGLFCGFWAFASFAEAISVGLLGQADQYPFGGEGPAGDIWYYRTATKYVWVVSVSGILWSALFAFTVRNAVKRSVKGLLICGGLAVLLFVAEVINAHVLP